MDTAYETLAEDLDLEAITSSEHNANILEMIRGDDHDWNQKLFLLENEIDGDHDEYVIREDDDLFWLGYFIGRSESLMELHIKYFPEGERRMTSFMKGFQQNKSIRELYISTDLGRVGYHGVREMLSRNNDLFNLCFYEYSIDEEGAKNIARMLGHEQYSSLKRIYFIRNNLSYTGLGNITTALGKQPQIEDLKMCDNDISSDGCVALSNAMETWEGSSLKQLMLCHNDIDDEGINALVRGMANCNYLEVFTLFGNDSITPAGLTSFSTYLQSKNCCLKRLDIGSMNIDCAGVEALATGLSRNTALKSLCMSENAIGDDGIDTLVSSLSTCSNLDELHISEDGTFSAIGLKSLCSLFQTGTGVNLKCLNIRDNNIDDNGLKALTEGMTSCCSLTALDLSHNESITAAGLKAFVQSSPRSLIELALWGMRLGDDGATALAEGLVGNDTMEKLYFCPGYSGVGSKGWMALSNLLFDPSSVNDTYKSNHTLTCVGGYNSSGAPDLARFHIFLHNCFYSRNAATIKILIHHDDIDVIPFFRWKLMCLPLLIEWLDTSRPWLEKVLAIILQHQHYFRSDDVPGLIGTVGNRLQRLPNKELSIMYNFVRGMPMLAIGRDEKN